MDGNTKKKDISYNNDVGVKTEEVDDIEWNNTDSQNATSEEKRNGDKIITEKNSAETQNFKRRRISLSDKADNYNEVKSNNQAEGDKHDDDNIDRNYFNYFLFC